MILPMILTGIAGLALGIAIMRLMQARGQGAQDEVAGPAEDNASSGPKAVPAMPSTLSSPRVVLGIAAVLVLAAGGIFAYRSMQGPANQPLATGSATAMAPSPDAKLDDVDTMISRLEARLQKNPTDGEGFRMLGWSFQNTGKPAEAALAYAKAVKLLPDRADVQAGYAEALVAVAGDRVTAEAKSHVDRALQIDPKEPRALFLQALHKSQNGQERAALDAWVALANSAPAEQPWQADLRQRIDVLAKKLGVDVAGKVSAMPNPVMPAAPAAFAGPSPAQMAAASSLPPSQQQSMIDGMVNGLAAKLRANPGDVDGWLKLIRSRVVLKDLVQARADLATARKALSSQPAKLSQVNALAAELGL